MNKFKLLLAIILLPIILLCQETTRDKSMSSLAENSISVTIGGAFIVNGSFPASPFERVDQFVTRVYNLYKGQLMGGMQEKEDIEQVQAKLDNFAQRDIVFKRVNEKDMIIDLEKFRMTGDFKYNPYLRNDDVLIYPNLDLTRNFISIDGAVNRPIKFQFVKGDKLSDALLFAGGINNAYEKVKEIEINRLSYDGTKDVSLKVKVSDDILLKVGDRIRVLADETNRKEFKALVVGEVNRPGFIAITKNNSTLKDVIEKAGGIKETAALYKAELLKGTRYTDYKNHLFSKEFKQNQNDNYRFESVMYDRYDNSTVNKLLLERTTNLIDKDSLSFKMDYLIKWFFRNNIVDFTKLNDNDSYESKTIIDDGDVIIIPKEDNQVYVFGQIASVGFQNYIEGKDFEYYIQSAGGLSASAKEIDKVLIIKARNKNWLHADKNIKIESGDLIYIPREIPVSFTERMNEILPIASIVSTIATIAILVIQLNK